MEARNTPPTPPAAPRKGGRPSREDAGRIGERILAVATDLFLADGYGATSIEAVAQRAGISKRTFYHRFSSKAELFGAVVHRLVAHVRPANDRQLFEGASLDQVLLQLARAMLRAALSPQALALNRVILAEAMRFPELAAAVNEQGARREAIVRIGGLLGHEARAGRLRVADTTFAAEQFLQMVISRPQRRALGLGTPMTEAELDAWAEKTVDLFLDGCRAAAPEGAAENTA